MFAQAGTLNPEKEGETFGDHRENILKTAKNLVEDTKNLVVAAQGSQEQLATAAQSVLASMTNVVDHVKLGATALGSEDNEAQVFESSAYIWMKKKENALKGAVYSLSGLHYLIVHIYPYGW